MYNADFYECHALVGYITPDEYSTEQNTSDWIDMTNYERIAVVLLSKTVGTTLDMDVEIATDTSASNLYTLKSATQMTDDINAVTIDVQAEEMPNPSSASGTEYRYLRVETTPSGNCKYTVLVFGWRARYEPVATTNYTENVT